MAWIQLGLQEYECSREPAEALRCFDHALALEPKATPASLFKGMVYVDLGMPEQALLALNTAHPDKHSQALRQQLSGDALHNLGRLEEACTAYRDAIGFAGNDPVLNSKLGYTEVRLGRTKDGITRLKRAVENAPAAPDIRERLMKAYVAVNSLSEAAEQAEKLADLEGTAKAYLRAASIRVPCQTAAGGEKRYSTAESRSFLILPTSDELWLKCGLRPDPSTPAAERAPELRA